MYAVYDYVIAGRDMNEVYVALYYDVLAQHHPILLLINFILFRTQFLYFSLL